MPIGETETHPFLTLQESRPGFDPLIYEKMIIGTFPVYEITSSAPTDIKGVKKKEGWTKTAFFSYFYGSRKNAFWKMLAEGQSCAFPQHETDCINLLNNSGLFITDVIEKAERVDYKPADSGLQNIQLNKKIKTLIPLLPNLKKICFTSDLAKELFCEILEIPDTGRIQVFKSGEKDITLYTLPSPAGNGRTARYYFNDYLPTNDEVYRKANKLPYALAYRQRLYHECLFS